LLCESHSQEAMLQYQPMSHSAPQPMPRCVTMPPQQRSSSFGPANLDTENLPLAPGDVVCERGNAEGIMRLGATGGFMGHVLLVVAPPRGVRRHSAEAFTYENMWPTEARMLWIVRTRESCRNADGYTETNYIMYIDGRGHVRLLGAHEPHQLTKYDSATEVQLFCCPPELRMHLRWDLMSEVLQSMRESDANWSWNTAVRAFLFSADVSEMQDDSADDVLSSIRKCWKSSPICTSVVIVFWQKYLCRLADQHPNTHAADWIVSWMPVKADRALPGELLSAMERCGWIVVDTLHEGRARAASF